MIKFTEIALREKAHHEIRYKTGEKLRGTVSKAYIATEYAKYRKELFNEVKNKNILEIGCGIGIDRALKYSKKNCKYTGVDVSEKCINFNKKEAEENNLQVDFVLDDANLLTTLEGQKFDHIIMSGVLHHLELNLALPTLKKLLNNNGQIIMSEPMGTNIFINFFRSITPLIRTRDEHPLTFQDLAYIKELFPKTTFELHSLLSVFLIPFAFIPSKFIHKKLKRISFFIGFIDSKLVKIPILKRLAWVVLIKSRI